MGIFSDRRVIITGGAGDIGKETARQFLQHDATVMLIDIDREALAAAKEELDSNRCYTHTADVTKEEAVKGYVETAQTTMGGIDIFFNNAAIEGDVLPIVDYPLETFHKLLHVNVLGVWLGLKYVMAAMQEKGGSIVITSSVAGQSGTPNVSGYVMSKHAVVGMMKCAALEGAAHNIRVNTVHPSPVNGRMMDSLEQGFGEGNEQAIEEQFRQQIPLQRYAESADVANLVLFLCRDDSSFLTGGQYNVDGGMSAK